MYRLQSIHISFKIEIAIFEGNIKKNRHYMSFMNRIVF